jgi:hypothetical protein
MSRLTKGGHVVPSRDATRSLHEQGKWWFAGSSGCLAIGASTWGTVMAGFPAKAPNEVVMSLDARRDGDRLVVQHGTTLPDRCPFCNASATHPTTLHFGNRYQSHSYVTVHFFLCDEHAARQVSVKRFCLVVFLLINLGFALLIGAWSGHLQLHLRGPARDGRVWISGLCPAFLGEFSDSSS